MRVLCGADMHLEDELKITSYFSDIAQSKKIN